MKTDYKFGLSKKQLFLIIICKFLFRNKYIKFKKGVDLGQYPYCSYKHNIKF